MAFLLSTGAATMQPASRLMASPAGGGQSKKATLQPVSAVSPDIPFNYESQSEQQLLDLANQSRAEKGLSPLTLDAGLSKAAHDHAQAMLDGHQLSHQLRNEPALAQRVAAATKLQLDQEGENVALDYDAERGHQHLMLSPPHRANLLNPAYDVVGLGVVRSGDQIYIVQDFGHSLPSYSPAELKDQIARAVEQERQKGSRAQLPRHDLPTADEVACSMAQADKLGTDPVRALSRQYTVLAYTSLNPRTLPNAATQALAARRVNSFSVGACYGRSTTYPTGMYWIVLSLN
ncbi:MAG: CAP domain-containing protein [Candidatus Sulfotelmatobacter sp.]